MTTWNVSIKRRILGDCEYSLVNASTPAAQRSITCGGALRRSRFRPSSCFRKQHFYSFNRHLP